MKRFLPLFILTGLLFGQDVLILKSGESYKGSYVKKVDELIVFQVEGENHFTPFPINDVLIIKTSNWGDLLFGQDVLFLKSGEFYKGRYVKKVDKLIVFQVEGENHFTPFPINDVAIIKTSNWGELTYPFNIPRKAYSDYIRISPEEKFVMNGILCAAGLWLLPRLFIYLVMRSIQYNN